MWKRITPFYQRNSTNETIISFANTGWNWRFQRSACAILGCVSSRDGLYVGRDASAVDVLMGGRLEQVVYGALYDGHAIGHRGLVVYFRILTGKSYKIESIIEESLVGIW